jgi:outer membrane receptor protein involved in Fe transport
MNKTSLLGATALRTFAAAGLVFGFASPAFAQETQEEEAQETPAPGQPTSEVEAESDTQADATPDEGEIVVTGSRIRRPNLDSPVPITAIGGDELFQTGQVSVGDVLNELPALRSTFSQANSTRFLGTAGLNLLDLRGLGTVRTLVLQNGRRHVGGDVLSSGVTPDVNTFPADLVERVEVVTGGNSAVYGSDAIAGVVNFILKRDFEGLQLRGQGGVSKYGDAGAYFISGLAGTNFADDRGNVAINVEYARQNQYFGNNRPYIASQDAFLVVDSDLASDPFGSDGNPDRLFFRDIRSASLTNTGALRFGGTTAANSCGTDPLGGFYPCFFLFQPDGTLIPGTGTRVGVTPGSFIGGNSENFRQGNQFQLSPQLDRYNINALGQFEVAPAFVPFFEAKYSRTDSVGTGSSGPAFIQGQTLGDPFQLATGGVNRETVRVDNPFLSAQARAVITAERARSGLTTTGATRLSIRQNLLGLGARTEEAKRETYRVVGGVRGDFLDDWSYEVAVNYGRLKEETAILGNLDAQRFLLGLDSAVNPATGQIQCRSQFVPGAAFGYTPSPDVDATDPNGAARLASDIAACVPINPFGGQFSQAVRDYVLRDTVATGRTSQFNAVGFVSGDTSQFLNLPGGPIGFVLGAEYRKDNLFYEQDQDVQLGYTFYNAIPTFEAPASKVKEAFAEIRLPILRDLPFAQELEVAGAARVSDYNIGNTGTVWAYNGSVVYSPVRGLRFRGNYGRSVRAPNQVELFSPFSQNFAPGFTDPCSSVNIAGGPNRAQNCAAAGRPGGTDATPNPSTPQTPAPNPAGPYDFRYDSSLEFRSGGNANLEAEKSDSFTVGFVATPTGLPGFSLSVDYYNIKVNDVIFGVGAQTIVNQCYDLPAGNAFCDLFQRVPAGQVGPNGEQAFRIIEADLIQGPVNFAKLVAKGIDFEVAYRRQLANVGRIDTRFTYTRVLDRSDYTDPSNPDFQNVIVGRAGGELGDPRDSFTWDLNLQRGPVTFGYQMRYLHKMFLPNGNVLDTYEFFNPVQDRDPTNLDFADRRRFPSVFYHDVRVAFDATDKFNFYVGVDNLTNREPPLGQTGIGGGSAIYDNRGRFFYAGAVAKF